MLLDKYLHLRLVAQMLAKDSKFPPVYESISYVYSLCIFYKISFLLFYANFLNKSFSSYAPYNRLIVSIFVFGVWFMSSLLSPKSRGNGKTTSCTKTQAYLHVNTRIYSKPDIVVNICQHSSSLETCLLNGGRDATDMVVIYCLI